MKNRKKISLRQARLVGDCLYLDWEQVDLEQFRQGLMGYRRVGRDNTSSAYPEAILAGRTVLEHMQQFPDYFVRLARLRAEARVRAATQKARPTQQTP